MPMLLEHIDAIARKKQRAVLYLTFHPKKSKKGSSMSVFSSFNWKNDQRRNQVCEWLTAHHIAWQPCGHIASENSMLPYIGQIYLDVPFDENDPQYVLVRDYLEFPDGRLRFKTVGFWYLTLEKAMENAHHDEPGFWEKWAENF